MAMGCKDFRITEDMARFGIPTRILYNTNANLRMAGDLFHILSCGDPLQYLSEESKERIRYTMMHHEQIFREQVQILHKLYSVQRSAMEEMGRANICNEKSLESEFDSTTQNQGTFNDNLAGMPQTYKGELVAHAPLSFSPMNGFKNINSNNYLMFCNREVQTSLICKNGKIEIDLEKPPEDYEEVNYHTEPHKQFPFLPNIQSSELVSGILEDTISRSGHGLVPLSSFFQANSLRDGNKLCINSPDTVATYSSEMQDRHSQFNGNGHLSSCPVSEEQCQFNYQSLRNGQDAVDGSTSDDSNSPQCIEDIVLQAPLPYVGQGQGATIEYFLKCNEKTLDGHEDLHENADEVSCSTLCIEVPQTASSVTSASPEGLASNEIKKLAAGVSCMPASSSLAIRTGMEVEPNSPSNQSNVLAAPTAESHTERESVAITSGEPQNGVAHESLQSQYFLNSEENSTKLRELSKSSVGKMAVEDAERVSRVEFGNIISKEATPKETCESIAAMILLTLKHMTIHPRGLSEENGTSYEKHEQCSRHVPTAEISAEDAAAQQVTKPVRRRRERKKYVAGSHITTRRLTRVRRR